MLTFIIRRLAIGAFTLLVITFVIYGLIRSMPGTPLTVSMNEIDPSKQPSPERVKQLQAAYGLDKPWPVAYVHWIGKLFQGDMGRSFSRKQPVSKIIGERIGPTLLLSIPSLLLGLLLAIPLGLYCSARDGKPEERIISTFLYMLYSFPSFVAALFLQLYFAVHLRWLPLFGMVGDNYAQLSTLGKTWDLFLHALLPVTVFTYGSLAYDARFIRANMQEVLRQDYIRTARAKGLGPFAVIWRHAFRNTLIPLVTKLGLMLPALLSGAVIVEQIFTWPGMGRQFFESITERDYPTVMGLTLMFSILTLAAQLLADILYAVVDPRIRLEQ
ncbi:ABC transporter permease [Planctomicrobium piriforme]|uniref:Peptide/nickel transport system permease protein n=1 Tax=Planctomicrobium piriforme TaxID=1576369 RepID=A0A1I3GVZ5_9PLAN|nr:ABC transporter permease [Planctomicrobium piriforme]SFI27573.1 peptide/nickel transport system permease protein [Planctomicrobium piriforme]